MRSSSMPNVLVYAAIEGDPRNKASKALLQIQAVLPSTSLR
jgi:hypothetical protein